MRITFVLPLLDVSGGGRIVAGHAQRLAARGHDVVVMVPRGRPPWRQRLKTLFAPKRASEERAHVALAGVKMLVPKHYGPIVESDVPDADVIIATWWETAEWIWPMHASKGVKVHFIQGYDEPPEDVGKRVEAVWRLPTAKIAIARWLIDLGREHFGISEIALVPNSVDDCFFATVTPTPRDCPTVGFLFHNSAVKDLPTTFAALTEVKKSLPHVRVVSFGAVLPNSGLPPHVEFHHLPTREQIAEIYARCDAWLSTSRTEGFNLPPLEAMASGCPAVCSKTGRPLEIIEDGVNGYLVDAGDVEGFAKAVMKILSLSDDGWQTMSEAARCSVAHPTWDESSQLFEQALFRAVQS